MSRRALEAKKKRLERDLAAVADLLEKSKANSRLRCDLCGRTTPVASLTLEAAGRPTYRCPKCGGINVAVDRPEVLEVIKYFKRVK